MIIKKLTILTLVASIFYPIETYADFKTEVCNEALQNQISPKRPRKLKLLKVLLTTRFAPKKMIQFHQREIASPDLENKKSQNRIVFINLPKTMLTREERLALRSYQLKLNTMRSVLTQAGFYQMTQAANSTEECVQYLENTPSAMNSLLEAHEMSSPLNALEKKSQDEKSYNQYLKRKKHLIRNGWKVVKDLNLNQIHHMISFMKPTSVMLISHAALDGSIYDIEGKVVPESYFQSLPHSVSNLIFYNCYSQQSVNKYLNNKYNISLLAHYPLAKASFEQILNDQIPLNSLKRINQLKLRGKKQTTEGLCSIEMDTSSNKNYALFLNKIYLGMLDESFTFNCKLLSQNNEIEIYSTNNNPILSSLAISSVLVRTPAKDFNLSTQEFISRVTQRHIVTKTSFSIGGTDETY